VKLEKKHIIKLRKYPKIFFYKILNVLKLEGFQEHVLQAVADHSRVAVAATHSVGKTFIMGRIALWFLSTYKNSKVITTAPTYRQVVKLLWGELRSAYKNAKYPIGGHLTTNELKINDDWYAIGYSPRKEAAQDEREQKGSTFQGFHALYILVIFDEATGIHPDIWKMVEGLLTSGKIVKFVCIGNPTTRNCEFFKCFKNPIWKKIYISCFDSPNLIANGISNKEELKKEINYLKTLTEEERILRIENYVKPAPYLLSTQWVVNYVMRWGFNHPLVLSKAFGEFPKESDNVVVQLSEVEEAINREYKIKSKDVRCIGVDCARFGEDSTVITEIIGNKTTRKKAFGKKDTMETASEVMGFIKDSNRKTLVLVDGTGIGAGVVDKLNLNKQKREIPHFVTIIEVNFGQTCTLPYDKKHYANLKAKIFVELGEDLKTELDLIDDSVYLGELPNIKYKINDRGVMQIESKEDYKKRTGLSSPDHADSLAIANYGRHYVAPENTEEQKNEDNNNFAPSINNETW
jgi:hypothetical protein